MKSRISIAVILGVTLFAVSCETLKVDSPKALQTSSQEFSLAGGHITIKVVFNRAVDRSTVVVGKTLVLVTEKDPNATGILTWSADNTWFKFRTTKSRTDLLKYDPDGHFTLKLIGSDTGNGAIKDSSRRHLDGDSDNADGGDYTTSFVHIG